MTAPQNVFAVRPVGQTPDAFLQECFRRMVRHREGVLDGRDPETIHSMRVASRRLRAAIAFFRGQVPRRRRRRASRTVKRITNGLGEVRQLDVSFTLLDLLIAESPDARNAADFARLLLAADRGRALARAQLAIQRTDFGKLRRRILKVEKTLRGCNAASLSERARSRVEKRAERLAALWEGDGSKPAAGSLADAKQPLHAMRIATKKLRYALETGERTCGWRPRRVIKTARDVQEALGHLHDLEVLRHWCEARGGIPGGPLHALARHIQERESASLHAVTALRGAARETFLQPFGARPSRRAPARKTVPSTMQRQAT
jgi:CHAD domain-containing protein